MDPINPSTSWVELLTSQLPEELRNDHKWYGTYGASRQCGSSKRKRIDDDIQSSASMTVLIGRKLKRKGLLKLRQKRQQRGRYCRHNKVKGRKQIVCGLQAMGKGKACSKRKGQSMQQM
ncbi:unnamed protein product [Cochlearia groenlandica]